MTGDATAPEGLCGRLHAAVRRLPVLSFPAVKDRLPSDGVYFLFEEGEVGHDGARIVRVGSHTGDGNLPNRLIEHTTENKDRSIFRNNLGRALLNKSHDPFLEQWNWNLVSRKKRELYGSRLDTRRQHEVEEAVTSYIVDAFSFAVIALEDSGARLPLEKAFIATVAQCPSCRPSTDWLGNSSPLESIRTSGLWLKQHLHGKVLTFSQLEWLERP